MWELAAGILIAAGFCIINGVNDGGALAGLAVRIRPSRWVPIAILCVGILTAPLLLGTTVAQTLTDELVELGGNGDARLARLAMMAAVLAAIVVVAGLALSGKPTSLTLALIGGLTGVGLGLGLPVAFRSILVVLAIAVLSPLLAGGVALVLAMLTRFVRTRAGASDRLRTGHTLGFVALSTAYGVNDGQKMLAVVMLAVPADRSTNLVLFLQLLPIALLFAVGAYLGTMRVGGAVTTGLGPARANQVVVAEGATAFAVLGSGLLGAPVSMTQSLTGGMVGAAASEGVTRVRWSATNRIAIAWVLTLPAATLGGIAFGGITRLVA